MLQEKSAEADEHAGLRKGLCDLRLKGEMLFSDRAGHNLKKCGPKSACMSSSKSPTFSPEGHLYARVRVAALVYLPCAICTYSPRVTWPLHPDAADGLGNP
jgi:hypothetical protein